MIKSVNCLPSGLVEKVEEMKRKIGRTKSRRREGKAIEKQRETERGNVEEKDESTKGGLLENGLTKAFKESGKGKGKGRERLVGFGIWRAS